MTIPRLKDYKILRLFVFSLLYVLIATQLIFGQSFFSMKGFGEEMLCTDARCASLAGLVNLGNENPAAPLILKSAEFQASILSNFVYGQQVEMKRMIYDIRPLMVAGKIALPYRFCFGLKLSEVFNQNFDIYSESIQVANYWTRRHIIGKGGIFGISTLLSKRFFDDKISLGFEYSKLIGQELEQWNFEVFQGNYSTSDTVEIQYAAHRLRVGLIGKFRCLQIGLIGEDILPGTINQKVVSHNAVVDSTSGVKVDLPNSLGLGVSFNRIPKTTLYADLFLRNWSRSTINDTVISTYSNSMKISLGAEYLLTENILLRFGVRYYQSYQTDINNYKISEYAITAGSRVPIPKFGGFDFGLELIQRQGRDIKETIGRLGLSLAYEEVWKKRTRRWGY